MQRVRYWPNPAFSYLIVRVRTSDADASGIGRSTSLRDFLPSTFGCVLKAEKSKGEYLYLLEFIISSLRVDKWHILFP
jgi:hypothetical protein